MSDETDKPGDEIAEQAQGPRAGERLRDARREKEITVLEVAKELHLDEPKVRALENNEFDVLGAPVFAKGHLKKYAEMVGVDFDDILADYYEMHRAAPEPLVIPRRVRMRKELTPGPWIAVIIVIVIAAAAYWWFAVRTPVPEPIPENVSEPVEQAETRAGEEEASDAATGEQPEVDLPEPEAVIAPVPEPADDQVNLAVQFSGDCWTEISDAGGNRLFFGLGKNGRTINVSGAGPLNILFGDAANVTMRVDGVDRPIAAAERRGKTARLTIRP
jgi:cytoskeletal protein RodZ